MVKQLPIVGFIIAIVASGIALYFLFDLRKRFFTLLASKELKTHEDVLADLLKRLKMSEAEALLLRKRIETLEEIGERSFQKIGFMRFNPFEDTGGDQSFSLAVLDREDNGFVISSLYGREGTRVYAKAVDHGASKHPLSEEEKEVLHRAMEK